MPQFQDLARPVLVAISDLAGDQYREVEGPELMAELERRGHEVEPIALLNLMSRLKEDSYVTFYAAFGMDPKALNLIRLAERGRQEVENWPRPGALSAHDLEALFRAFEEQANDPDLSEADRSRARSIASAGRDLTVEVSGSVIASWLRSIGIG